MTVDNFLKVTFSHCKLIFWKWCSGVQILPDLPEFQLSLKPDDYVLPEIDSAWGSEKWEIPCQPLKEHLKDFEDAMETE